MNERIQGTLCTYQEAPKAQSKRLFSTEDEKKEPDPLEVQQKKER
jgi:hypothetical protein